ncbi:unnamed protein product [Trichobilharzia szidati]|nr:unnamed protein product [Trichobilharzia szidati]CAH8856398.1 unnamed protein product [Trichobilharzia szidati]
MILKKKSLGSRILIGKIILLTLYTILIVHTHFEYFHSKEIVYNYTREILITGDTQQSESIENCRTVCENIQSVPRHRIDEFKQSGAITVNANLTDAEIMMNDTFSPHLIGGSWMFKEENDDLESNCDDVPKSGVAIIFVCKNRWKQLSITLSTLIPILQKQRLCYRIFVVEQEADGLLNKAMLLNIGFLEAKKRFDFACVVFHDADLAPLDDRIPYGCDEQTMKTVVHLSVGVSSWNYSLPYKTLIGGVLKISTEHFLAANGYSNSYWGWGAEDDDLERRLNATNIEYIHINESIARYMALPHPKQTRSRSKLRYSLLDKASERMHTDGLNTLKYKIITTSERRYYTYFLVSFHRPF